MGREIRRVPPNWEHPRDAKGNHVPMFDETYEDALKEWSSEYPEEEKPDPECHRPAFTEEPTAYQIYQNVSEGTPVSPVFETVDALVEWLVEQGHSKSVAKQFAEAGYAPSFLIHAGKGVIAQGIDVYDVV